MQGAATRRMRCHLGGPEHLPDKPVSHRCKPSIALVHSPLQPRNHRVRVLQSHRCLFLLATRNEINHLFGFSLHVAAHLLKMRLRGEVGRRLLVLMPG